MIYKNGLVFIDGELKKLDVEITRGIVTKIAKNIEGDEIFDCSNMLISPAFIDVHTHIRTPGYEYKEDIVSCTKAAAKGGYQLIVGMPNTNPTLDNTNTIKSFTKLTKEAIVNVKTLSAITTGLSGRDIVDIQGINELDMVCGFSDDGKGVQNNEVMEEVMAIVAKTNSIISAHAEDEKELGSVIGCVHDGAFASRHNFTGINSASEWKQVERDVKLAIKNNCKYHVCHISTKETVSIIRNAKKTSKNISCEVTPHHLTLCDEDIVYNDGNYKMNPPLRTKADRNSLISGLNDGTIEVIATDHAPHSADEKNKGLKESNFGIIGLETAFATLNTYLVRINLVKLETILKALTNGPAKVFGVGEPNIEIGKKANITIIDLEKEKTLTADNIVSKSKNTPYIGKKLTGWPVLTIVNGRIVYVGEENE